MMVIILFGWQWDDKEREGARQWVGEENERGVRGRLVEVVRGLRAGPTAIGPARHSSSICWNLFS